MRKFYVDGPWGQVHGRELGEGQPLLLLHQTAWSSLQYKNAMPHLAARGFRCIAIDTPGYGLSDGPALPPTIGDYADALAVVLDKLSLDRTMVLGHHTGASIATALGAAYPGEIEKLILHGVPIYDEQTRQERLSRPHYDQTPQADGSHITNRWALADKVSGGTATPEAIHWSLVHFFYAGPNEWFGHHAAFSYDLETDFKALTVPTIVVSNSGDVLHSKMPYLEELRPDFTYVSMDGGTFHIVFEDAKHWASVVADAILGDDQ